MLEWSDDLRLSGTDWFLDSRRPRSQCFISHAHSDHLGFHRLTLATPATAAFARYRLRDEVPDHDLDAGPTTPGRQVRELPFREQLSLDRDLSVELFAAGHILGSAMIHVTRPQGTLLYTGDFKMRAALTAEPTEAPSADVLVMESTYGLPSFRFPPRQQVMDELLERVQSAMREGQQPIVMGYSLGKAQEITRILRDAKIPVTAHGAVYAMNRQYEALGMRIGECRRYAFDDFHGAKALPLEERGVLVAPPSVARSGFSTRFEKSCKIVMTGWAILKDAKYRYGVDHALPLSDHADFDELLELIDVVQPKRILTHHGYKEFVDHLRARGHDAALARPEAQMTLFG